MNMYNCPLPIAMAAIVVIQGDLGVVQYMACRNALVHVLSLGYIAIRIHGNTLARLIEL